VTLLEAGHHFGGHANTVDMTLNGVSQGVDTGFLVFNHRTYPLLTQLFEELQVPTAAAEMSFSVQVPQADGRAGLEWSGSSLGASSLSAATCCAPFSEDAGRDPALQSSGHTHRPGRRRSRPAQLHRSLSG
jgi:predicted NAD/FAD-binding protein